LNSLELPFTGAIREDDSKGRHVTTGRSLHRIPRGELEARRLSSYQKLVREQAFNSATLAEKRAEPRSDRCKGDLGGFRPEGEPGANYSCISGNGQKQNIKDAIQSPKLFSRARKSLTKCENILNDTFQSCESSVRFLRHHL